jgi:hypothetical protein
VARLLLKLNCHCQTILRSNMKQITSSVNEISPFGKTFVKNNFSSFRFCSSFSCFRLGRSILRRLRLFKFTYFGLF